MTGESRREATGANRSGTRAVQEFYGQWLVLYDLVARYAPRVTAIRRAAAGALRLDPGDTVVEMGAGTGANLPYLRSAVGHEGRVVGLDVTRPGLVRARKRGRGDADLLWADATTPPIAGPVDGVVASFVSGMFEDPAAVVDRWCDLVRPGGHVVLVDAAPSERAYAAPVNAVFRAVTTLSTPPTTQIRYERDLARTLDDRVTAAHRAVRDRSVAVARDDYLLGLVRLTGGRIE